jgi:hypothetical protein
MTRSGSAFHNPAMSPDDEAALDLPIAYIERTRAWYAALGYPAPYVWAHFDDVPFQPLRKPLADCVVTLVTTAAPFDPSKGPQGPGAPYNAAAKFFEPYTGDTAANHDLRIAHVAIDRVHTTMEDPGSWFPLPLLRQLAGEGRLRLAPSFHGMPTNRSQRHTLETDVPLLVQRCRDDGVDAAVLVPNCPVCHQTLSLAARGLEAAGITTVVMGCARDIVEHAGVPRLLFSDFPLGNAAGKPHDRDSQRDTLERALRLLESATAPRTTVQSPQRWAADGAWKRDYSNPALLSAEELARRRAEWDRAKVVVKEGR